MIYLLALWILGGIPGVFLWRWHSTHQTCVKNKPGDIPTYTAFTKYGAWTNADMLFCVSIHLIASAGASIVCVLLVIGERGYLEFIPRCYKAVAAWMEEKAP